jgi:hypothetical protein
MGDIASTGDLTQGEASLIAFANLCSELSNGTVTNCMLFEEEIHPRGSANEH